MVAVSPPAFRMAGGAAGFDPQGTREVLSEFYYCLAGRAVKNFARTSILVHRTGSFVGDAKAAEGNDDS